MNDTETNYSVREKEVLAVFIALKEFVMYFLSSKMFVLKENHKASRTAFTKKHLHHFLACLLCCDTGLYRFTPLVRHDTYNEWWLSVQGWMYYQPKA